MTDIVMLEERARRMRQQAIFMINKAGSGHPGGSLSSADVISALFFGNVIQHRPAEPLWEERDRFVLSAGHIAPIYYAALAEAGYFPLEELVTLRHLDSRLQGHPHLGALPGVETSTGSLGQGFSVAVGMALGFKLRRKLEHVYCLMGDGEQAEGQVWEAAAAAAKFGLVNLIAIIDLNGMEQNGPTLEIMPQGDLAERYRILGWDVQEIDGHDLAAIQDALFAARAGSGAPQMIVAHTTMGKGVSFMEAEAYRWHGKAPTDEQTTVALAELGGAS